RDERETDRRKAPEREEYDRSRDLPPDRSRRVHRSDAPSAGYHAIVPQSDRELCDPAVVSRSSGRSWAAFAGIVLTVAEEIVRDAPSRQQAPRRLPATDRVVGPSDEMPCRRGRCQGHWKHPRRHSSRAAQAAPTAGITPAGKDENVD